MSDAPDPIPIEPVLPVEPDDPEASPALTEDRVADAATTPSPSETPSARVELEKVLPHVLRYVRGKRGGDLVALLLVGSAARRRLTPHSDIDVIALVKGQDEGQEWVRVAERQVEIKYRAQKLVEEELRQVPRLPPLLRKARVLFELEGAGSRLIERASQCFRQGMPAPTLPERLRLKAECLHWLGKAEDLAGDPPTSQYLLNGFLEAWLTALFRLRGWWPTAPSDTLRFLGSRDKALADLFAIALSAPALADRLDATRQLARVTFADIPNPPRVD